MSLQHDSLLPQRESKAEAAMTFMSYTQKSHPVIFEIYVATQASFSVGGGCARKGVNIGRQESLRAGHPVGGHINTRLKARSLKN